jgi:acyl-CoA thioesterase-1
MRSIRAGLVALAVLSVAASGCARDEAVSERRTPEAAVAPLSDGAAGSSPAADAAPAAPRPRVVFLGDSLTAGYGLERSESVPALIQARLDAGGYRYEVVNAGVSGDTSAGGLSRLDWSLEGDVDVLVIELGGNDGLRGLPPAAMKQNLDLIIRRARARGIDVLLTGMEAPPNFGAAYTAEFRQVFRDLARQHGIAFVPFFLEGVAGIPHLNLGDGIHPNPQGARVVSDTVWRALEPLLDGPGDDGGEGAAARALPEDGSHR